MKNIAMHGWVLLLTFSLLTASARPQTQAEEPGVTILLVHGAFADSSSWHKVVPLLRAKGLHVVTVDIPLTSLARDVEVTRAAIEQQHGPIILVGHSYGGAVITQAGNGPSVKGLVYLAAYAPGENQTVTDLGKGFARAPGRDEIRPDSRGFLSLTEKGVDEDFAQDLTASEKRAVFQAQIPLAAASLSTKLSDAAWTSKPSWYVVAANDRIIPPDEERGMAKRIGARTIEVSSSHVVMLSHPQQAADVILDAVSGIHRTHQGMAPPGGCLARL